MAKNSEVPKVTKENIPNWADGLSQYFPRRSKVENAASGVIMPQNSEAHFDTLSLYLNIIENRIECAKDQECAGQLAKNLTDELYKDETLKASLDAEKITKDNLEQLVKEDIQYRATLPFYDPKLPSSASGNPEGSTFGVALKADSPNVNTPVQTQATAITPQAGATYVVYEDTRDYPNQQNYSSWILSWEPTQKVGIVKVPILKIINSLGANALDRSNNANPFQDATLFELSDLIDFEKVNGRVFLPLSSNKLILLKDFSIQRKNIQSAEVTYGSRYFQVFAESFPDFTMQIDVVIFHEVAKKVKLFFDNVMKRISETSRYSGSLYIHDVLAEEIPAFDAVRLSNLVSTKQLVRYRLLPRAIRANRSAEDPNMLKLTIEGIVVEWEKQDESLINLTTNSMTGTREAKPKSSTQDTSSGEPVAPNPAQTQTQVTDSQGRTYTLSGLLISPSEKYANSFKDVNLGALAAVDVNNGSVFSYKSVERVVKKFGNTLFKDNTEVLEGYTATDKDNFNNLWNLLYLEKTVKPGDFNLSATAIKELIKDTTDIYNQIATKLSTSYAPNKKADYYSNLYNSLVGRAIKDLEVPGNQHVNFKAGLNRYLRTVARQDGKIHFAERLKDYGVITESEFNYLLRGEIQDGAIQ